MNTITKKLSLLLFGIIFSVISINKVYAANASISVSSNTSKAVIGNTVTVTVTLKSTNSKYTMGSWVYKLNYDSKKFKLVSGDIVNSDSASNKTGIKSKSYTYKFKAIGTGNATFSVSSYSICDYKTENELSISTSSKTIKVITQAELEASYSKNNNLKSLSIDGTTLSPAFNANTTSYTVKMESNTQYVNVKATLADSKAELSGTGKHDVSEGENKIVVIVTAENGSTKKYTIIVNVIDPNPIIVNVNNEELTIVKRESNLTAPENYTKKTITINEQNIPAFYNEINDITLVGLKNSEGDINLFIYKDNTYTPYKELKLDQIKILPLSMDKTFENYKKEDLIIDEVSYEALKINNTNLYIIHARNLLTGKEDYYTYDNELNNITKFDDNIFKEFKTQNEKNKKLIMLLGGETVLIIIILISVLASNSKRKKSESKKIIEDKKEEEIKEKKNTKKTKKEEKNEKSN